VTNHWPVWVYPPRLPKVNADVPFIIARDWNDKVIQTLRQGGRVLLLADTARLVPRVSASFSGISWNTVWSGTPPDKLGILCDPEDSALRFFPTAYYSNWQWWDLVRHSRPLVMNHMPPSLRPIVQVIPDWNKNNRIGLVLEARVGKGKLLMTGIDLIDDMKDRPVARQMLYSLERYAGSRTFDPQTEVAEKDIAWLFKKPVR
jgi:hypothetical protein